MRWWGRLCLPGKSLLWREVSPGPPETETLPPPTGAHGASPRQSSPHHPLFRVIAIIISHASANGLSFCFLKEMCITT